MTIVTNDSSDAAARVTRRRRIRNRERLTAAEILAEVAAQDHLTIADHDTADDDIPAVIAEEIRTLLVDLVPLADLVHHSVDTRRPGAGYLSPQAREALDRNVRDDRIGRIDTTDRPVGQQWMRGTTTEDPIGEGKIGGRPAAISCQAEIVFTLHDLIRRLHSGLERAGLDPRFHGVGRQLPSEPDVADLAAGVATLVDLTLTHGWTSLLPGVRRELEHLTDTANTVVDGPGKLEYGDCPHCGRPSIVAFFDDPTDPVLRCDRDRTTGHYEPCTCTDAYCACKYKPVTHRHEWFKSKTYAGNGWWTFERLRRQAEDSNTTQSTTSTRNRKEPSP